MKNIIKYYYNLDVTYIRQVADTYYLAIEKNNYLFCRCDADELEIIEKFLINNIKYHKLIFTVNNEKTIIYNNHNYALLKINTVFRLADINDIIDSMVLLPYNINIQERWIRLWSEHIDYIEYQMNEISVKFPSLFRNVYYYIGLVESAIQLLKTMDNQNVDSYIVHKRVKANTNLVELYNPCLAIIDTRVRDIAEFYKDKFFFTNISAENLCNQIFIMLNNFSDNEKRLFFVRMMYPSYFFDVYDDIIRKNKEDIILEQLLNKNVEYEDILKNILNEIKKTTYIQNIDWLI